MCRQLRQTLQGRRRQGRAGCPQHRSSIALQTRRCALRRPGRRPPPGVRGGTPSALQMHEPILTLSGSEGLAAGCAGAYDALAAVGLPINLVVPYDDVPEGTYRWLVHLPVAAVSLDFLGSPAAEYGSQTAQLVARHGFPKVGCAGCMAGHLCGTVCVATPASRIASAWLWSSWRAPARRRRCPARPHPACRTSAWVRA